MADHRPVGFSGDVRRVLHAEDGVAYRGFHQDHAGIKRHVEFLDHKVNGAPTRGNPNRWAYAGSIPMVLLMDWLKARAIPFDVYARNEDDTRVRFIEWLKATHPKLMPRAGAEARPCVVVPLTYKARKNAEIEA